MDSAGWGQQDLAKVGVEGSNPFARSNKSMSDPETWVTERPYDMGDNLGPKGLSRGCRGLRSKSK